MLHTREKFFSRFLFGSLLCIVAPSCQAQIKVTDDLLEPFEVRTLSHLAEDLSAPNLPLFGKEAILYCELAGSRVRVIFVAAPDNDSEKLAGTVTSWKNSQNFEGTVFFKTTDNFSGAVFRFEETKFGQTKSEVSVQFEPLFNEFRSQFPEGRIFFSDAIWAPISLSKQPDHTTKKGTRTWDITAWNEPFPPMVGKTELKWWAPIQFLIFILLLPVACVVSIGGAIIAAKRHDLPIERRRTLFRNFLQYGIFVPMGIHATIALPSLMTKSLDPLSYLWFGASFTKIALPFMGLVIAILVGLSSMLRKTEHTLFGVEESAESEPRFTFREVQKRKFFYSLPFVLGVTFACFALIAYLDVTLKLGALPTVTLIIILALLMIMFFVRPGNEFKVSDEELVEAKTRLKRIAEDVAQKMDVRLPKLRISTHSMDGGVSGKTTPFHLMVTIHSMDFLNDDELRFLVGHELAHHKLGHVRHRMIMVGIIMVFGLGMMVFMNLVPRENRMHFAYFSFIPMIAFLIAVSAGTKKLRRHEVEADQLAVRTTGDPDSGISALQKIMDSSVLPGVHTIETTHPAMADRFAAISDLKAELAN